MNENHSRQALGAPESSRASVRRLWASRVVPDQCTNGFCGWGHLQPRSHPSRAENQLQSLTQLSKGRWPGWPTSLWISWSGGYDSLTLSTATPHHCELPKRYQTKQTREISIINTWKLKRILRITLFEYNRSSCTVLIWSTLFFDKGRVNSLDVICFQKIIELFTVRTDFPIRFCWITRLLVNNLIFCFVTPPSILWSKNYVSGSLDRRYIFR